MSAYFTIVFLMHVLAAFPPVCVLLPHEFYLHSGVLITVSKELFYE